MKCYIVFVFFLVLARFPSVSGQPVVTSSGKSQDLGIRISNRLLQVQDKNYRELSKEFSVAWGNFFSTTDKTHIEEVVRLMDERNLPDHPFLGIYSVLLLEYSKEREFPVAINEWHNFFLDYLLSRPVS